MRSAQSALFYSVIGIFVATATITILGVAGIISIDDKYLTPLFTALLIELVAAVIGLFKATDWFGRSSLSDSVNVVAGDWWQFVRSGGQNAFAFVRIGFSDTEQQLSLEGDAFDADGNKHGRFWSISASLNAATLDLHYFWKGDHERSDEDYSGVGYVRFDQPASSKRPARGTGWFTAGNIDLVRVTARRKVEMRRATDDESRIMNASDDLSVIRQRASAVYADWSRRESRSEVV